MPWGYRASNSRSNRSGGTSAWNTSGETSSLRNACAQYDLTEEQVAKADPPISCQWRSCHGNSYAVVKLSDMAALKRRLAEQANEAKKQAMIDELGEEGYKAKVEADAAAAIAKRVREQASQTLVSSLEDAIAASGSGIATSLAGMTISKTASKNEWYVRPEELECITPVDPSKAQKKYHLVDVIRVAHEKSAHQSINGTHISTRVKAFPARQKLYARYLHHIYETNRVEVDDEKIVEMACHVVRGKIAKAVNVKAAAAKEAQDELKVEQNRLAAFDGLVEGMQSSGGGNQKKRSSAATAKNTAADTDSGIVDENAENGSKKPAAAKKRKVTKKKANDSDDEDDEPAAAAARSTGLGDRRSKRNNAVSYAETNTDDEEEG